MEREKMKNKIAVQELTITLESPGAGEVSALVKREVNGVVDGRNRIHGNGGAQVLAPRMEYG
ncbi:MAG: hypothetical protein H8E40_16405 [Chloroflexi bacterium]|nr:hypothetical protein [Chloroflexota bacterium]